MSYLAYLTQQKHERLALNPPKYSFLALAILGLDFYL